MKEPLEALAKRSEDGDREDALALWSQATKETNTPLALQAATLLGYESQVDDWLFSLWAKKDWKTCSELAAAFGVAVDESTLAALHKELKSANGRRKSILSPRALFHFLCKCCQQPNQLFFDTSYVTDYGATIFLGGTQGEEGAVWVGKFKPEIRYLATADGGHERIEIKEPTITAILEETYENWDAWSDEERLQSFGEWAAKQEDALTFKAITPTFPPENEQSKKTPGSDILTEEENAIFAEVLTLHEQGTQDWGQLMKLVAQPQGVGYIGEVGLALVNRLIHNWPTEERYGTPIFSNCNNPEPWIHLARRFSIPERLNDDERSLIKEGALRNAMRFDLPGTLDAVQAALQPENQLGNLREINWHFNTSPKQKGWFAIPALPVWQQITRMHWSNCSAPDTNGAGKQVQSNPLKGTERLLAKTLTQMPRLETLHINGVQIDQAIAEALVGLPALDTLELTDCNFTAEAEEVLTKALPAQLETLKLGRNDLPKHFGADARGVFIKEFHLYDNYVITRGAVSNFCSAPCCAQLEVCVLEVRHEYALRALASHPAPSPLRRLELRKECTLVDTTIELLIGPGNFDALEEFEYSLDTGWGPSERSRALFVRMLNAPLPSLRKCEFKGFYIESEILEEALAGTSPPQLKDLTLPDIRPCKAPAGKAVGRWEGLQVLDRLSFEHCSGKVFKTALKAIRASAYFRADMELVLTQ